MKGWLDKCFADKVAYDTTNLKWFDDGPLKVMKPACILCSHVIGPEPGPLGLRTGYMPVITYI